MEFKGCDYDLELSPITATNASNASAVVLNLIRAGVNSWNRVGRIITLRYCRLTGLIGFIITPDAITGNVSGNVVRCVVVWDRQPSGALPNFEAICNYTEQDGFEQNSFMAPVRYDNLARFTILDDFTVVGNPASTPSVGATQAMRIYVPFDRYVTLGNRQTVYQANSAPAGIGDISSGGLYVYFRSLINTATDYAEVATPSVARVRYSDD